MASTRGGSTQPRRATGNLSMVSENSKPQDSDQSAAPDASSFEGATESAPEHGTAVAAASSAPPSSAQDTGAPPAEVQDTGDPATTKIRLDDAGKSEPMRPAARMPLALPSDDEIAAALAKSVNEEGPVSGVHVQRNPTNMITMRPPAEDVAKRQAAMERAANTKPVLTRVFQVLIAVFYPIVLLVLSIRLVTSSVFLWIEYHRPGFPADSFGFSTDDRLTYGSYTIDYLLNFASPRYLGDLVNNIGKPLFLSREVGHMADVKTVIVMAFLVGLTLAIIMVIAMVYLARRSSGGIRRALFAGSIATLVLILALGVFAATGWDRFFTDFHKIFFANGTWTFYTDDTLIRLFPSQFWLDSGIFIGAFVLVVSSLTLAFTWPAKSRRHAVSASPRAGRRAA